MSRHTKTVYKPKVVILAFPKLEIEGHFISIYLKAAVDKCHQSYWWFLEGVSVELGTR